MKKNPGTPLSSAALKHFAFGDQRLAVGSRPAGRRWRIDLGNGLFCFIHFLPHFAGCFDFAAPSSSFSIKFRLLMLHPHFSQAL